MNPIVTYNTQGMEVRTGDVVRLRGRNMIFTGVGLDGRLGFVTTDDRRMFVAVAPETINWTNEETK